MKYELEELDGNQGRHWRIWINDNDLIFFDKKTGVQVVEALNLAESLQGVQSCLETDTRMLNWLQSKCVNVREPLRYGSRDMFWSSPQDDEGDVTLSDIREQIHKAMQ